MFGSLKKLFGGEEKEEKIIAAPVNGTAIPMSQVSDPTSARRFWEREQQLYRRTAGWLRRQTDW